MKQLSFILFFGIVFSCIFSCKRADEKLITDSAAKLSFSSDSIEFDTILASSNITSITERLIVTNRNKNAIKISSIQLAGMAASNYKVIVNGIEGFYTSNIELNGGDSIYILVRLSISNPQSTNLPYVLEDTLTFSTNGNIQKVKLIAYGQNANFFKGDKVLGCDTVWQDPKPHVILKSVTVPAGCTLTIKKGVRIFAHENAVIKVNGTLLVEGEKDSVNLVRFQGDKFGERFQNLPGQWQGIVFNSGSKGNNIRYAEIKNAVTGIRMNPEVDGDTLPELIIKNTIIRNMTLYGIQAISTDLYALNCLGVSCARNVIAGMGGGNYHFVHCTFANYSYDFFREDPLFRLTKTATMDDFSSVTGEISSSIKNSIVWGDLSEELQLELTNATDLQIFNSIVRSKKSLGPNVLFQNIDPKFKDPRRYNFHPDSAVVYSKGIGVPDIFEDLEGTSRQGSFTLGTYHK